MMLQGRKAVAVLMPEVLGNGHHMQPCFYQVGMGYDCKCYGCGRALYFQQSWSVQQVREYINNRWAFKRCGEGV